MNALHPEFIAKLISITPFTPHDYAQIEDAYPPNAMPQLAYQQFVKKYHALEDVDAWRIEYESGGHRVTGMMAAPRQLQQNGHPLMVYNRGGFKHYGMLTAHSLMQNLVPFARQGYIAFASNYRGNDGGEGEDHFGGQDVADVLQLLALAKLHPAWDLKNSYLLGHSRGGMMTLRALAEGAAVNAAIAIAPIADLFIGGEEEWRRFLRFIPEFDGDAKAQLTARSAAYWPEKINVPLLLMHGDADTVVPHEHSVVLHEKLQQLANPHQHELVIYPAGNHALVRQWDEVLARSLQWFDAHKR